MTQNDVIILSIFDLAVGSRDLSQAEEEITACKAEQIQKMTIIFTKNGSNFFKFPEL